MSRKDFRIIRNLSDYLCTAENGKKFPVSAYSRNEAYAIAMDTLYGQKLKCVSVKKMPCAGI